jgi:NADPH-dependent ferric siderophore reductase
MATPAQPEQSTTASDPRARRPLRAAVQTVEELTPHMVRVVLGGEELAEFAISGAFTDHYVKLQLPAPGAPYDATADYDEVRARLPREQWPRTRTYTVRAWDAARALLSIDFVHHGDEGVAGPWAAAARPGDALQLRATAGGAYAPDPEADWHLMAGDSSVIPAISASLARIPAGVPVHVFLEVDDAREQQPLESSGELHVTWLHRDQREREDDAEEPLLEAVRALAFPAGAVHGFVHGEAGSVRALRRHLLLDRGVPREALSVSGYWKRSRTEEGWREDKPEWNRQVEQDVS